MKVHMVVGRTGEYSDNITWPVIAYLDESRAQDHVLRATEKAKEWEVLHGDKNLRDYPGWNEYDPAMRMEPYTGTDYYYRSVELADYTK